MTAKRIVLFLTGISILAGLVSGSTFYYNIGYFWGLLFAGSWLFSKYALHCLEVRRTARNQRSQVGQIFEERFELINNSRIPHFMVEVRDESPLPGAHASHVLSQIKPGETRTYLVRTRVMERGIFPLGPTILSSGDIFGLFPVNKSFPVRNSLLVYPIIEEVRKFPSPAGWLPGGEALRRRTHQITPNAAGVRDYITGDSLNRIHWVSTARRNRLIVKEFELDPLAEVWIFLDAAKDVQVELPAEPLIVDARDRWRPVISIPLPPSSLEYSISVAASLSRYFLRHNRSVGLISAGRVITSIPSDRGARQLGKILEALALIRGEGKLPIEAVLTAQIPNLPRGSTVIVISPATGAGYMVGIEELTRRGMHPIAVAIDSKSFGGKTGSDWIIAELSNSKIPFCRIANRDNLSNSLSNDFLFI